MLGQNLAEVPFFLSRTINMDEPFDSSLPEYSTPLSFSLPLPHGYQSTPTSTSMVPATFHPLQQQQQQQSQMVPATFNPLQQQQQQQSQYPQQYQQQHYQQHYQSPFPTTFPPTSCPGVFAHPEYIQLGQMSTQLHAEIRRLKEENYSRTLPPTT
jgi:hypothetical protein